jgi:hypothetical protein
MIKILPGLKASVGLESAQSYAAYFAQLATDRCSDKILANEGFGCVFRLALNGVPREIIVWGLPQTPQGPLMMIGLREELETQIPAVKELIAESPWDGGSGSEQRWENFKRMCAAEQQ